MYKQAPGYSEKATSLFVLDLGPPQDLPDALRGEAWLFVQLPLSMLQQELRSVESRAIFGDSFQLTTAGLDDLPADTLIPGAPLCSLLRLSHSRIEPKELHSERRLFTSRTTSLMPWHKTPVLSYTDHATRCSCVLPVRSRGYTVRSLDTHWSALTMPHM